MNTTYDPSEIEPRWQRFWEERALFRALNPRDSGFDPRQPKFYVLDMFPYPSGAGLHVGHPIGYIGSDIVARRKRMEGFNVLHPMGYDAFGLPAEQYAIQTGAHPAESTRANIETFRAQLKRIGLSFDWARELATCDPEYYRWTQWIFARLFDLGLAYQAEVPVWWCEELKTVLANEEVINGRSERGGFPCVKRPLKQWMLRITAYAERLLADLDELDWPESVKAMQREWIGRSEGAEIEFPIEGHDEKLVVFTTRPDTVYGATFLVLAPEHPLVEALTTAGARPAVADYVERAAAKSELERTDLAKEKSGVFTGAYAWNPARERNDARGRIPIFVADYVLPHYGSGAIMAVPGQDQRDWDFAKKYGLPILRTVEPPAGFTGEAYEGEGPAIESPRWDGLPVALAKERAIRGLETEKKGRARVTYKLRDWLFSRQRYWGEPFPILHHADGRVTRVRDEDLPVELPPMKDFTPAADGSSPLARAKEWVETVDPETGLSARRDTDTMPGWAGSCWYYLRFMDPRNDRAPFDSTAQQYWKSVDLYVGGVEHAVLHLLYARFWHKVLYDLGLVTTKEPFQRLFNQGLLTAFAYRDGEGRLVPADQVEEPEQLTIVTTEAVASADSAELKSREHAATPGRLGGRKIFVKRSTGEPVEQIVAKMSKSLRNVVNPDEVIAQYGVDTFRVYEMFMGPLGESKPWNPRDVAGARRFLDRVWWLFVDEQGEQGIRADLLNEQEDAPQGAALLLERELARMLARVDDSFEHFNFNTAIAAMMEFTNEATKRRAAFTRGQAERFLRALSPIAPHIAEELWSRLRQPDSITRASWPKPDPLYLEVGEIEIPVQVNGKLRARVMVPKEIDPRGLEERARSAVAQHLDGKRVKKTVVVPGRLVNFVVA